ncbi:hypothetical protein JTE90_021093 [Oedothorax gibbosus]|uniref:Secreted protein n=1 Tax=Oedothorax gibbosus TaxID=931172 RepID=A0AAV6VTG5_9ARAC|nr:hypothetical protein JTE90_021093 [Oedothorax gibbosus]
MLFVVTLFSFGICQGWGDETPNCDQSIIMRCYPSHLQDISFPENERDLNKVCPTLLSYTNCLMSYADECGLENSRIDVVMEERLEPFNEVLQDACDISSELHHDLAKNLGCLKNVVLNHRNSCDWTDEVMEMSKRYLFDDETALSFDEDYIDWGKFFCLNRALDAACFASDTSKQCGFEAKGLILDILKRIGHLEVVCAGENGESLADIIEHLKMEAETKVIFIKMYDG